MQPATTASSSTVSSTITPRMGDFDLAGMVDTVQASPFSGFFDFLSSAWTVYSIFAFILCIIFLTMYVFASIKKNLYGNLFTQTLRDAEKLYDETYRGAARNDRMADVFKHSESDNPNDWKLAIIEADIILDGILKKKGYAGNSLGERLKSISPQQLSTLNDAWEAHKIRNNIAHAGSDFVLTKRLLEETISKYQRVFSEFGEI